MSNYNQTLQTNNSSLEEIITKLNNLPDAGGGLDTSDATATSGDILSGKTAYVDGEKITGTIATVTQTTPSITINASGLITATATQTAGYIAAGTKSATKQLAFQAAKTITPGTANQTAVSSGYYTGGSVVVKGDSNLVAGNIKSGVSIFGVTGNYEGSGSGGSGDASMEDALVTRKISGTYVNNQVSVIGNYAFALCSYLTSVNFPQCTSIYGSAFYSCTTLESVSFPQCIYIGSSAFYNCLGLVSVSFPQCTSISSGAFYDCGNLKSVNFPQCTLIGSSVFYRCTRLTSVSFPLCTSINRGAFYSCSSLTSVNFPQCTIIGSSAFNSCSSLTSVNFPQCTSIYGSAFYSCRSLTSVNFPQCTIIGNSVFYGCDSLTNVSFPLCTNIGSLAFYYCRILTNVSFPQCTSINNGAFYGCGNLISVSFPQCTIIHSSAFYSCSSLTSVSFPLCKSIGIYAFAGCSNLWQIYLGASSVCSLAASNAFSYTSIWSNKGSIFVPASLVESYKAATNWTFFSNRIYSYDFSDNSGSGEDDTGESDDLITFTIDGSLSNTSTLSYSVKKGTTWATFVPYSNDDLLIYNNHVCYLSFDCVVTTEEFNEVSPGDVIEATTYYAMTL